MSIANPIGDQLDAKPDYSLKIICLGDSAVGKSNNTISSSTHAVRIFKRTEFLNEKVLEINFWDTAGQERFSKLHPSYYQGAHACILVFDVTRKISYDNLKCWYEELRQYRPEIPCLCFANKIDGVNVVSGFRQSIELALEYCQNPTDFADHIREELNMMDEDSTGTID